MPDHTDKPDPTDPQQPEGASPDPAAGPPADPAPGSPADPVAGRPAAPDPASPVDPVDPAGPVEPTDPVGPAEPTDPAAEQPAGTPEGDALVQEVTADDLDAPDVHPGAADPAAAASPAGRSGMAAAAAVLLAVIILVVALVLLTRGGGDEAAYVVYGEEVSREELAERMEGLAPEEVVEAVEDVEDAEPEVQSRLASVVSTLITLDVLEGAAAAEGVEVTEADVDEELANAIDAGFDGDRATFEAQIAGAGMTEDDVRLQLRTALLAEALVGDDVPPPDDAAVQAAYDQQYAFPVVSAILAESQEAADDALARIEAGEDFADVAADVSADPASAASGGELGPLGPGMLPEDLQAAADALEAGQVSDVVASDIGFTILKVDEPPALEEVEEDIRTQLTDQQLAVAFSDLAEQLDEEAQITVDPAFGTWSGLAQGGLVPPVSEATATDLPLPAPSE